MEVWRVYPEIRCQGSSAPGITANYICKGEAMHSIFNHCVDGNIKQGLNNMHVCTSVVVNMCQNAIPKPTFFCAQIHPTPFILNKKKLPNIYMKGFSVVEPSVFMLPSQVCVLPVGISLLPLRARIQEGSKSQGPLGSNRLQTPCELPEGNLGLIGSALPQHPWQSWTPSKTCHIEETDSVASRSMNACSGGRWRRASNPSSILFPWGKCLCVFKEHRAAQTIYNIY